MTENDIILLVGHGSRDQAGNREIERFAQQWRSRRPELTIELCFIELADVLLDEGLDRAARPGGRVIVVPLILNAAGHVKMEIPEAIEHARLRHTASQFVYARHLGACDEILTVLKRQLGRAMRTLDHPDPRTTGVILLGRGSSDRVANAEVSRMARWLYETADHSLVDIAFTGVTHPRLETVVQRQVKLDMGQIVILPYYLFTGTLIERIRRQGERLRTQYPTIPMALGEYFGFDDEIFLLLEQRVAEAAGSMPLAMMECDGCKYREFAADHGEGHHHHS